MTDDNKKIQFQQMTFSATCRTKSNAFQRYSILEICYRSKINHIIHEILAKLLKTFFTIE